MSVQENTQESENSLLEIESVHESVTTAGAGPALSEPARPVTRAGVAQSTALARHTAPGVSAGSHRPLPQTPEAGGPSGASGNGGRQHPRPRPLPEPGDRGICRFSRCRWAQERAAPSESPCEARVWWVARCRASPSTEGGPVASGATAPARGLRVCPLGTAPWSLVCASRIEMSDVRSHFNTVIEY